MYILEFIYNSRGAQVDFPGGGGGGGAGKLRRHDLENL